jgi:hypothetical protein
MTTHALTHIHTLTNQSSFLYWIWSPWIFVVVVVVVVVVLRMGAGGRLYLLNQTNIISF